MAIRFKVRDILKILREDGWLLLRTKGSHQQYAHPVKKGLVTVSFHSSNEDLHPKTAASIFRQACIKQKG
jgi:predicted RNA binding protein YcfA (HicA-like mRNA interferase family)